MMMNNRTDSMDDLIARARLVQDYTRETVKELRGSIEQQQMAKKIVDLELQIRDMKNLFEPFLQEFECEFDNDEICTSEKIAEDYIKAATLMAERYGRVKGHRIREVQAWLDSPDSLPFK